MTPCLVVYGKAGMSAVVTPWPWVSSSKRAPHAYVWEAAPAFRDRPDTDEDHRAVNLVTDHGKPYMRFTIAAFIGFRSSCR